MNRYEKGQIYKIVDVGYNKMYIGSTTEPLSKRMERHRSAYKDYLMQKMHWVSSFSMFDEFGNENCKIEWVEDYPCKTKKELEAREGQIQKENDWVNKNIAGQTIKEWTQKNKAHLKRLNQEYYCRDTEARKEKSKKYYYANKPKVLADRAQQITCECGSVFRKGNKTRHEKTQKHQDWLKQQEQE